MKLLSSTPLALLSLLLSVDFCSGLPKRAVSSNPMLIHGKFSKTPFLPIYDDEEISKSAKVERPGTLAGPPKTGIQAVRYDVKSKGVDYFYVPQDIIEGLNNSTGQRTSTTESRTGPSLSKRVIVGPDDRVEVCDTNKYPSSVIGRLLCTDNVDPNLAHGCTATFVGPRTILTSGHCVHPGTGGTGAFYRDCKFTQYIHDNCGSSVTTREWGMREIWVRSGWINDMGDWSDIAVVHLDTNDAGRGHMSIGYDPSFAVGDTINANGFPGDKPETHMFHAEGKVTQINDDTIFFDADSNHGQSGSAVYAYYPSEDKRTVYGVLKGSPDIIAATTNYGVRINGAVYNLICGWLDMAGTHITGCP